MSIFASTTNIIRFYLWSLMQGFLLIFISITIFFCTFLIQRKKSAKHVCDWQKNFISKLKNCNLKRTLCFQYFIINNKESLLDKVSVPTRIISVQFQTIWKNHAMINPLETKINRNRKLVKQRSFLPFLLALILPNKYILIFTEFFIKIFRVFWDFSEFFCFQNLFLNLSEISWKYLENILNLNRCIFCISVQNFKHFGTWKFERLNEGFITSSRAFVK